MTTENAVADGMFPINAAGSTHPNNGLVDGATTMTTAPHFSEPTTTDGIVGKVLAAGIAAKGAEIATTAGDKPEGLVATSDAAVHHVTTTASKGTQVHVATTPEKFSILSFLDKLEHHAASKELGYVPNSVIAAAFVEHPDVAALLTAQKVDVASLKVGLEREITLEVRAHHKAKEAHDKGTKTMHPIGAVTNPFLETASHLDVKAVMERRDVTAAEAFKAFVFDLEAHYGRTLDAFEIAGVSATSLFPEGHKMRSLGSKHQPNGSYMNLAAKRDNGPPAIA